MSRVDFTSFAAKHPEFDRIFSQVDQWMKSHRTVRYVEPERVARDLADVSTDDLLVAFAVLVNEGHLSRYYKVRPRYSHTFVDKVFNSPEEIRQQVLRDASDRIVDLDEVDVVTVFGRQGGDERRAY